MRTRTEIHVCEHCGRDFPTANAVLIHHGRSFCGRERFRSEGLESEVVRSKIVDYLCSQRGLVCAPDGTAAGDVTVGAGLHCVRDVLRELNAMHLDGTLWTMSTRRGIVRVELTPRGRKCCGRLSRVV